MKKILTLLLVAGAFTVANAQTSRDDARRVILGGGSRDNGSTSSGNGRDVILGGGGDNRNNYPTYPNSYPSGNSRQAEIDRINRDYETKIQSIRNNPYLSYDEKDRAIRQLDRDRQRRIQEVENSYRNNNGRYDDDRYDNDRRDNGKHKGWSKGKGNPHRDGGKDWKNGRN